MRRLAASSSGPVQLDAHGSTIVREKSVTPRLRMASCQRGSACTISSQAMNSSAMIGACTPRIGSQDTTDWSVSETTASYVVRSPRSYTTRCASLGSGALSGDQASSADLVGSFSVTKTNRALVPRSFPLRSRVDAAAISSPVSGSSGWAAVVTAGSSTAVMPVLLSCRWSDGGRASP